MVAATPPCVASASVDALHRARLPADLAKNSPPPARASLPDRAACAARWPQSLAYIATGPALNAGGRGPAPFNDGTQWQRRRGSCWIISQPLPTLSLPARGDTMEVR